LHAAQGGDERARGGRGTRRRSSSPLLRATPGSQGANALLRSTCTPRGATLGAMAQVELSPHLPTLFPQLGRGPIEVAASTVSELIQRLDELAPGVAFYICDERGRLRQHVNVFVAGEMIVDRRALSDELEPATRVFIAQALSGG
jgi:molybdopterin synthase sulfur carrier subunit